MVGGFPEYTNPSPEPVIGVLCLPADITTILAFYIFFLRIVM
jgi:hypothetical protein